MKGNEPMNDEATYEAESEYLATREKAANRPKAEIDERPLTPEELAAFPF